MYDKVELFKEETMALSERDIVKEISTGKIGVIMPQSQFFPEDGPHRVCFVEGRGTNSYESDDEFEVIGKEAPIANMQKCGAGKGEKCCIFMTMSGKDLICNRFTSMDETLRFHKAEMSAKREPHELFPDCQLKA